MTTISARRTRTTFVSAAIAATALAIALSGCTSTADGGGANLEDVVLHPSGNQGAWLSNDYAKGVGRVVELDDMLCGIQDDVAFHRDLSELGTSVIATDLATGTDLWRLETETPTGATCGTPLGDRMYTSESEIDENGAYRSIVVRVDLATGERTTIYEAPINIAYFDAFAHIDETVFARAGADRR